MKTFIMLALLASTSAFANNSLEQFAGKYKLISCKGDLGSNSEEPGQIITITTGEDWVNVATPNEAFDYMMNARITGINKEEVRDREESKWACINTTTKSIFKDNEVSERTNFVSYAFCKGIPTVFGKVIFKIKNLGNGNISILNKHTMIEDYTCNYKKI